MTISFTLVQWKTCLCWPQWLTVLGTPASAMDALRGNAPSQASPAPTGDSVWIPEGSSGRLHLPVNAGAKPPKWGSLFISTDAGSHLGQFLWIWKSSFCCAVHLVVQFWWKRIPLAFVFFFWKHLYLFKKSTVKYNLHPITYIYIRWTVEWVLMKVSIHVTTMTIKTHSTSITLRSPPDSAFEFPGHPAPSPRQFLICFLALCIRFLLF